MNSKAAREWLEGELEGFPSRASGEDLYRFFLQITKRIVESDDPEDRAWLIEGLREWIGLRNEPRTMLAVEIASVYHLHEMREDIQRLLDDVRAGNTFSRFYECPILKAINGLRT